MLPDGVGGGSVVARQVLGALAGRDDVEPGAARPLDELAGEGRLVPVRHREDHPGPFRFAREQRPGEHVRLDVHHDDVLAGRERGAGMADAGFRPAGGFHHHVDVGPRRERRPVVGEGGVRHEALAPADGTARGPGTVRFEVGNCGDPQSGGGGSLGEEHRAELAGADEPDSHRPRCVRPPEKIRMEIHAAFAPFQSVSGRKTRRTEGAAQPRCAGAGTAPGFRGRNRAGRGSSRCAPPGPVGREGGPTPGGFGFRSSPIVANAGAVQGRRETRRMRRGTGVRPGPVPEAPSNPWSDTDSGPEN